MARIRQGISSLYILAPRFFIDFIVLPFPEISAEALNWIQLFSQ